MHPRVDISPGLGVRPSAVSLTGGSDRGASRWSRLSALSSATPFLPDLPVWIIAVLLVLIGEALRQAFQSADISTPWWGLPSAIALLGVTAQEGVQRLIGGGRLDNRPMLRTTLALGEFAFVLDLCGAGFLLPVCGVAICAIHVQWSGSKAWRPTEVVLIAATALNQAAVVCHLVPSVLASRLSLVLYPLILGVSLLAVANVGLSAAAREQVTERLATAEQRFRALVQDCAEVITVIDQAGRFEEVSPAIEDILGLRAADLEGREAAELVDPRDRAAFQDHLMAVCAESLTQHRWESRTAAHPVRWLEFSAKDLTGNPAVRGVVLHIRDVTARRESQDRLAHLAAHDPLTGLLSRGEFLIRAARAISRVRPGESVGVLFCDLDGFKQVNDLLGHDAGDEVLRVMAQRLRSVAREDDVVARMGGDEFTVILAKVDRRAAEMVADRIRALAAEPVLFSSGEVAVIGISIGCTLVSDPEADLDEVLRTADVKMYAAKQHTRAAAPG